MVLVFLAILVPGMAWETYESRPEASSTLDDLLLEVSRGVSEFGGMHFDETGRLQILL